MPSFECCLVSPTRQNLYGKLSTYWKVVKTNKNGTLSEAFEIAQYDVNRQNI